MKSTTRIHQGRYGPYRALHSPKDHKGIKFNDAVSGMTNSRIGSNKFSNSPYRFLANGNQKSFFSRKYAAHPVCAPVFLKIQEKEVIEIESFKSSAQHSVNDFVVINIPEEDVEPKQIILDPDDQPMLESAKTVAPTLNSAIIQLDVDDNFVINSTHLNMIRENKFDGYLRADPHDHIPEFLAICNMFRYGETQSEAIKLLIFPFSLCDKAKIWFNKLNEESITSWEQMRKAFINKFFPPSSFNRLLLEIKSFSQLVCESLTKAWLRLKNMLQKCHGHGLTKGTIIQIFYHGLDEPTQAILDSLKEEMHEMRNKYQDLRDNHDPKNHLNDDTPMYKRHESNYIQYEDYQNQDSHDSFSHQSLYDPNDFEKSLSELNNDVRNDLDDFKRRIRSMRTVHDKLYESDDRKTTGVLPYEKSKTVNKKPQSKTDLEKSITKFLDGQRVTNMFFKNNVNETITRFIRNRWVLKACSHTLNATVVPTKVRFNILRFS
ncbi:reverse transcriptase domain-containing protein [Tanacetum coccineum]|uniref:Reverse transcriptase domain-containing protein n=1 Tax=Tanacetum coccineum TaxID=301880 RepID=A0ABQ5A0G7_9ASTR